MLSYYMLSYKLQYNCVKRPYSILILYAHTYSLIGLHKSAYTIHPYTRARASTRNIRVCNISRVDNQDEPFGVKLCTMANTTLQSFLIIHESVTPIFTSWVEFGDWQKLVAECCGLSVTNNYGGCRMSRGWSEFPLHIFIHSRMFVRVSTEL